MAPAHPIEKHEAVMADHETRIQSLEKGAAVREEQYRNDLYVAVLAQLGRLPEPLA